MYRQYIYFFLSSQNDISIIVPNFEVLTLFLQNSSKCRIGHPSIFACFAGNIIFPKFSPACPLHRCLSYIGLNTFRKKDFLRKLWKISSWKKFQKFHLLRIPYRWREKNNRNLPIFRLIK